MGRILVSLAILLFCSSHIANGQSLSTSDKKAIKYYDASRTQLGSRQFDEAIESLNLAIKRDPEFVEAYIRLASIYKSLLEPDMAYDNYLIVSELYPDSRKYSSVYFNLGSYEFSKGQYDLAQGHIKLYIKYKSSMDKNKILAEQMLRNCEFSLANMSFGFEFNPRPLPSVVNAFRMQYFPLLTVDQQQIIYIVREQDEEILISTKNGDTWGEPESISENINTEFNEGTCSISADGRILVFTSCMGRKGYGSCDLFITTKQGDNWEEPVNLGMNINSTAWDSQPSLSADGRTLFFVSNRAGGFGMRDIWFSRKKEDGTWGKAQNLGAKINSLKDDISPFIHPNNQRLYFAADGRLGFGGFDIYFTERDSLGQWKGITNFGYPINTHHDEVSMFITADGTKGYYSHEEIQDKERYSLLYEIDIPPVLQVENKSAYVTGKVSDAMTNEKLKADIKLIDIDTQSEVLKVSSDSITGKYFMVLTEGAEYALYVEKPGYLFRSYHFSYIDSVEVPKPIEIDISLEKINSGAQIVLNNIFFEFDSYELNSKSKVELEQVVSFLDANPQVEILVTGYTDNLGTEQYNLELSKNRANAVVQFLTAAGVENPKRLYYKGLGSQNPLVPNNSEVHRQQNRRIEFMIK